MASRRIHIVVADPSLIIRRGVTSALLDIESLGLDLSELEDLSTLGEWLERYEADVVILNPMHMGLAQPSEWLPAECGAKLIALQNSMLLPEQLKHYDGVLSLLDSAAQIEATLRKVVEADAPTSEEELSLREREIVASIARGMSNKEIADQLCISAHTVMTHRKNIAAKLKIHNPAGLTIYAIVNKLIDIGEVQ